MDTNIKCEMKKDFHELLEKIDFNSYNPSSPDFLNALRIGLMIHIFPDEMKEKTVEMYNEEYNEEYSDIKEEITGAKKYLQKYIDTGDSVFKEMTNDELKHAGILIKKAYSKLPSTEEKTKLKNYEDEIKEIKSHIE